MFTGIIEATGNLEKVQANGSNKTFLIRSPISHELKPDQSVAHDGVCLTIEAIAQDVHQVTAIQETLNKSTLDGWKVGDTINIERCMLMNGRLDGHIVQGHVDATAECTAKRELNGSWELQFTFPRQFSQLIIEKGSITINGISLTLFDVSPDAFCVAIIPYTYQHTNIGNINPGSKVNIEFDVIGKYVSRILEREKQSNG